MARKTRSFLDSTHLGSTHRETDDFGDLGPVVPADEMLEDIEPVVVQKPVPQPRQVEEVRLNGSDVFVAIKHGDSSGLPLRRGFDPSIVEDGIVLDQTSTEMTAAIAGHAVDCVLVHEVRLVSWNVRGNASGLSGKYRLENEVRIAVNGQVLTLKKGKEFFDHQLSVALVRQAGGIVLPIGTQE